MHVQDINLGGSPFRSSYKMVAANSSQKKIVLKMDKSVVFDQFDSKRNMI